MGKNRKNYSKLEIFKTVLRQPIGWHPQGGEMYSRLRTGGNSLPYLWKLSFISSKISRVGVLSSMMCWELKRIRDLLRQTQRKRGNAHQQLFFMVPRSQNKAWLQLKSDEIVDIYSHMVEIKSAWTEGPQNLGENHQETTLSKNTTIIELPG